MWQQDLIDLALGIVASIGVWLLLAKLLRPKVCIDSILYWEERPDGTRKYLLRYQNKTLIKIEDVSTFASLRVALPGAPPAGSEAETVFQVIDVPVDEPYKPQISGRLNHLRRHKPGAAERPKLRIDKVDLDEIPDQWDRANGDVCSILEAHPDNRLRFAVRAAHGLSGGYGTAYREFARGDVSPDPIPRNRRG